MVYLWAYNKPSKSIVSSVSGGKFIKKPKNDVIVMYGQIVGINSAKISQQGYEGIGFSIPINTAKTVVDSILQYGYVKGRVRFGFDCREIDSVTAKLNSIPVGFI